MNEFKISLSTLAAALAMQVGVADAAVAEHVFRSNAVNYCQAFTPGPANTIRNRVIGSENVGSAIAVACNYHSMTNGAASSAPPKRLSMYFSNNTAAALTVTCSLLTSYQGGGGYLVTKTTTVAASSNADANLSWSPADNPTAGATSLGDSFIGVNCTLPTGAVMNDSYFYWDMDNGV